MQIGPYLSSCTNLKSMQIENLNTKPHTLILIEENMENSFECVGTGDHFLNRTPIVQALRSAINKWERMKLKFL